jgi:hypothetical protein
MNRYALEMYAREKYQKHVVDASSPTPSRATSPRRLGFLLRRLSQPTEHQPEPLRDHSMAFIYELRRDLVDIDLDEVLPIK